MLVQHVTVFQVSSSQLLVGRQKAPRKLPGSIRRYPYSTFSCGDVITSIGAPAGSKILEISKQEYREQSNKGQHTTFRNPISVNSVRNTTPRERNQSILPRPENLHGPRRPHDEPEPRHGNR